MKKRTVIIIATILAFVALATFVYQYTFNSQHRDIANEAAISSMTASKLQAEFMDNEALAIGQYLDQVVAVKGILTEINRNEAVLNDKVLVTFLAETEPQLTIGSFVEIKGRCLGFDELLEMVKIDQATQLKKQ